MLFHPFRNCFGVILENWAWFVNKWVGLKRGVESFPLVEYHPMRPLPDFYQSEAQKSLSEHLILVRSGNETVNQLQDVIQQALKHPYSY